MLKHSTIDRALVQCYLAGLVSITCPNVCGRGYMPCKCIYFIKCMCLLARVYSISRTLGMYGIYTDFKCVWTYMCAWIYTNAQRSWSFMQVPKFIYLSEWISRRHKCAWRCWPTCSHTLTHARSNAAEVDFTDHTPQCVGKILGNSQGGNPWVPPVPAGCVCYNISSKIGQAAPAMEAFQNNNYDFMVWSISV